MEQHNLGWYSLVLSLIDHYQSRHQSTQLSLLKSYIQQVKNKNYYKAIYELCRHRGECDSLFFQWQKYQQETKVKELFKKEEEEQFDGNHQINAEEFILFEDMIKELKNRIRSTLGYIDCFWTELQRRKLEGGIMHQKGKDVMAE